MPSHVTGVFNHGYFHVYADLYAAWRGADDYASFGR